MCLSFGAYSPDCSLLDSYPFRILRHGLRTHIRCVFLRLVLRLYVFPVERNADSEMCDRVDNKQYFGGDIYAYRRAPLVLLLAPGDHKLDIRLVRDVRAMGGIGGPRISIKLEAEISDGTLVIAEQKLLVSDMVNGTLANPFASVPVRNEGQDWVDILTIESLTVRPEIIQNFRRPLMFFGGDMYCCHAGKDIVQAGAWTVEVTWVPPVCARTFGWVTVSESYLCYR